MKKKLLIESLLVTVGVFLLVTGIKMIQGFMITRRHVPDILENYGTTSYLQNEVSFGMINRFDGLSIMVTVGSLLLFATLYYTIRIRLSK